MPIILIKRSSNRQKAGIYHHPSEYVLVTKENPFPEEDYSIPKQAISKISDFMSN
jgi:hypothetical protein